MSTWCISLEWSTVMKRGMKMGRSNAGELKKQFKVFAIWEY